MWRLLAPMQKDRARDIDRPLIIVDSYNVAKTMYTFICIPRACIHRQEHTRPTATQVFCMQAVLLRDIQCARTTHEM